MTPEAGSAGVAPVVVPGTEGYADDAAWLIPRYEAVSFSEKYQAVLHLFPAQPCVVLDIGAGTGVDAAWLAERGHVAVAVEPVAALRDAGAALHRSSGIDWLDDSLPALSKLVQRRQLFDIVLVSAVWQHLATGERKQSMTTIANLLKPGALLVMSIRHGAAPANRRVFEVPAEETPALAAACGLAPVVNARTGSVQALNRQAGVTWTWLAFVK